MSRGKELAKNTLVITIGKISTQFVSFLLLPLYTALLSTSEYGTVDLFTTYISLLLPIVTLLIEQGAFRYMLDVMKDDKKLDEVITSSIVVTAIQCIIFIFIYLLLQNFISSEYKIFILINTIATILANLVLQHSRGMKDVFTYSIGSFLSAFINIVLNVVFIVGLRMGVTGMLLASFFGNVFCFIFIIFKKKIYSHFSIKLINLDIIWKMLKYSIPLVPNQLSMWIINSSNRTVVSFFLGTAANGLLAVSIKFSTIITTFFNIFYLSWSELVVTHFNDEDRDEFLSEMISKIFRIFACVCLGIIAFMPIVFPLLINEQYSEAYFQIPIYILATLCNILVGLLGVIYVVTKRTKELAKSTILSAVINIITHLILIKFLGLYATAISTFVGYAIVMIYRLIDTRKYVNIKYDKKMFIYIGVFSILSLIVYYYDNVFIQVIWAIIVVIYSIISNKEMLSDMINLIKNKLGVRNNSIK